MINNLVRSLAIAGILLICPLVLSAQHSAAEHDDEGHPVVCGTELYTNLNYEQILANTRRNAPDVYRRIVNSEKMDNASRLLGAEDTTYDFFVLNRVTEQFDVITARLVFKGRRARLWLDLNDTARVKRATILMLARGLDTATGTTSRNPAKGLIENDEEVFGLPPTNRFDAATPMVEDFLLTDIKDNISGGNILGYFMPMDQTNANGSNKMNILYIDSREGLGSQSTAAINGLLNTLAHEYQHLIHYKQNPQSQSFFNEGCSEVASILCGYKSRSNSTYLNSPNVPLLRWSNGTVYTDLEIDYQRAMSFSQYCYEQHGEAYLTKLTSTKSSGMNRVASALQQIGSPITWQTTLKGFAVANYVRKSFTDSQYIYVFPLSTSTAKVTNTYADTMAGNGQATVQQYAAIYNLYNFKSPAGMNIQFTAGNSFAVLALLYKGSQLLEVRELTPNAPNIIGSGPGYTKMVFTVVNLSSNSQAVQWSMTPLPAAVENEAVAGRSVAVTEVAPNPARGPVRVAYTTLGNAPVSMHVFDMSGRLVRTVIDGESVESGAHQTVIDPSGLPGGVYMIRLAQGTSAVTTAMIVEGR